jgi:hypothetical protein
VTLKSFKKAWSSADHFSDVQKDLSSELQKTLENLFLDEPLHDTVHEDMELDTSEDTQKFEWTEQELDRLNAVTLQCIESLAEEAQDIPVAPKQTITSEELSAEEPHGPTETHRGSWKKRVAVALLLVSLMGTAYLLRENIKAFGNADSSSTDSSLKPLQVDDLPQFSTEE